MWQLTMCCHALKAVRRDIMLIQNVLGTSPPPPMYKRPNVDGVIYIHYAAPSYSARSSAIYTSRLAKCLFGTEVLVT